MTADKSLIVAQGLTKTYTAKSGDVMAVKGIDFKVMPGTCTGLLGPNGAGKSTTMGMLMGLTRPTEGTLTIFGTPTSELTREQRVRISLVPQEDNLDPDLTVSENLFVYGLFFGIARSVLKDRVPQLLDYMQLTEKSGARVSQLSGGMKRRLTIARALINDPDLLILDEPTTGLDPQARVLIWQRLLELKKTGKTLLLTTHYMDEAQRLCDQIIMIDHGDILDEGTPRQLIKKHVPGHVFDMTKPIPKNLPLYEQEDVGDSVLFYVNDEDAVAFRKAIPEKATYLHRPANLEDVFLRLTGRRIRE
ncbi:MAG: hypothetical protein COY40_03920 [Alphaproteobacteria bacterium CG_4_10_14_0_8_um_filter_53_9]|nr:MAG: hypothetical protein COY40_03920 [Alphaproteobacteria bacterium CG_4_10_14_0_8_um_filter_53_9]